MSLITSTINNCLSGLLPYNYEEKTGGYLTKGLREYQLLLMATIEAVEAMRSYRWTQFDALVGENACQIRAVKIAWIAQQILSDPEREKSFTELAEKARQIWLKIEGIAEKDLSLAMRQRKSLKEIFTARELEVLLSGDQQFVLASFLLTATKVSIQASRSSLLSVDRSDSKRLKVFDCSKTETACVTASFASNLEGALRQKLATDSVAFLTQEIRLSLSETLRKKEIQTFLSQEYVFKQKGCWPTLPMFWTYAGLLDFTLKRDIPLLLQVDFLAEDGVDPVKNQAVYLFASNSQKNKYVPQLFSKGYENKPCLIVQGICNYSSDFNQQAWEKRFAQMNPVDLILANAATHRQYPDSLGDTRLPDTDYWQEYKAKGEKGCTDKDPSFFFIQHVYCAKLDGQFFNEEVVK